MEEHSFLEKRNEKNKEKEKVMNKLPSKINNQFKRKCKLDKIKIIEPLSPKEGLFLISKVLKEISCEFVSFTNNMVQSLLNFIPDVFGLKLIKDDECKYIFKKHEIIGISYTTGAHVFYSSPLFEREINEHKRRRSRRWRYFGGIDPRNRTKKVVFVRTSRGIKHNPKRSSKVWKKKSIKLQKCSYVSS